MTRRALAILCGFTLVALVLAIYWPVRQNGFVDFDDHEYIVGNPVVAQGLSWRGVRWAFTTTHTGNYHPVTWLSHMVDGQLFGVDDPGGHHLHSVVLHAASALVLFAVLHWTTGALGASFFAACVFAVHPLQVESVSWAAERKSVLAMLLWMLSLLAYVWYVDRPRPGRYAALVICFALALLSKQTVVTLPFVLLLLDYWPLKRVGGGGWVSGSRFEVASFKFPQPQTCNVQPETRNPQPETCSPQSATPDPQPDTCNVQPETRNLKPEIQSPQSPNPNPPTPDPRPPTPNPITWLVIEKLPLFLMTAAACLLTIYIQSGAGLVKAGVTRPLDVRIENAVVSYVAYLKKMLWPVDLAVFYPHPGDTLPTWKVAGSLALLLAITALVVRERTRRPYLLVGWLWYVGTLVPLIGLIQAGLHAITDRHSYIPLVGIFIAVTWLVREWASARGEGLGVRDQGLGVRGQGSGVRGQVLAETPHNRDPSQLAGAFQAPEAIPETPNPIPQTPGTRQRVVLALAGVAVVATLSVLSWRQVFLWRDSIALFEHTIAVTRNNDVARYNLALVLERAGRRSEAIPLYQQAVAINPQYISARLNLGAALAQEGWLAEAVEELEALLRLKPGDAMAHYNLARALEEQGDAARALGHYREALELDAAWPAPAIAQTWILAAHQSPHLRDGVEAVRLGSRAVRLATGQARAKDGQPNRPIPTGPPADPHMGAMAFDALAAAYAETGRFSQAQAAARQAVELALAARDLQLAREIQFARLRLYDERRPYRRGSRSPSEN